MYKEVERHRSTRGMEICFSDHMEHPLRSIKLHGRLGVLKFPCIIFLEL